LTVGGGSKGADVNAKDKDGKTPLHRVEYKGGKQLELASLLLAKGADVNAKDKDGKTPLHWAAYKGGKQLELASLLLANGADVNVVTPSGETPLFFADNTGYSDSAKMVKFLLSKGADTVIRVEGPSPTRDRNRIKMTTVAGDLLVQSGSTGGRLQIVSGMKKGEIETAAREKKVIIIKYFENEWKVGDLWTLFFENDVFRGKYEIG
jgi:ankyrin repeat protein